MTVRTRFAPSPTGYMHIGGMRTAFFAWLFARHMNGKFILRIDDTDEARNMSEALGPILQAFRWLGLDWDEGPEVGGDYGPYYQSQRGDLYRAAAEKLIASGHAYKDYSTPEEVKSDRDAADKAKTPYLNVRRSLDLTEAQKSQYEAEGRSWVLRFLIPRGQVLALDDIIRGHVEWDTSLLPDPVIVRANGGPLYNFATVVDDAQLKITHVIRAEEHLSNTPIQVLLHQALGNEMPRFAHVPYVAAPGSKEKLSKRKLGEYRKNPQFKRLFERGDEVFPKIGLPFTPERSPVAVEYYEKIGYLPAGVLNALGRLGWSLDEKTEIMSLAEMIQNFTLERVVKAPAGFDPDKLFSFQGHWMKELPLEKKVDGCLPYLVAAKFISEPVSAESREYVSRIIVGLGDRLKLFADILDAAFFFQDDYPIDEKMFQKRVLKEGIPALLEEFRQRLAIVEPFTLESIETALHEFAEAKGVAQGDMIHALRLSTTGCPVGPGVYDCLVLLGREKSIARIAASLARAPKPVG
jgi:glutamyl-tRNA synthetase